VPYQVCCGLHDNGNWCGASSSLSGQGNRQPDWRNLSVGDGFFTVTVLDKPWLVYSNSQAGIINLTDAQRRTEDDLSHPRTASARSVTQCSATSTATASARLTTCSRGPST